MSASISSSELVAEKDETAERLIPTVWRPVLQSIVSAFAKEDFQLAERVPEVEPVSIETAKLIRENVLNYGETIAELPADAWLTSVCQWYGSYWDALVDLWTIESGPSDLVLSVRVIEVQNGYHFKIHMVYVP